MQKPSWQPDRFFGREEALMRTNAIVLGIAVLAASARGDEPVTLKGFDGSVGSVAFSPDIRALAVGAGDGGVSLWDVNSGKKIDATPGLQAVSALAFTPDGTALVR